MPPSKESRDYLKEKLNRKWEGTHEKRYKLFNTARVIF
jgi:hypothetical protein